MDPAEGAAKRRAFQRHWVGVGRHGDLTGPEPEEARKPHVWGREWGGGWGVACRARGGEKRQGGEIRCRNYTPNFPAVPRV